MQVTLNPIQAEILETLVQQGQYPSLEMALNAALLGDDVQEEAESPRYAAWVEQTRQQINAARAQIAAGEVQTVDQVLAELRAKVQQGTGVDVVTSRSPPSPKPSPPSLILPPRLI
ncbi:hypothetical protein PN441_16250 [Spirulina major CS-329]|uniref:hypothetical protein n=1 Tax=Spirulina TaxID=1154 RepID=UPI00232F5300|nr:MULTISPECIES: hypothetical protein [Spirulina]MDB9494573.1 hypothetical protein [Spirulina subsalsa CS-330]MDB9504631.1 hypothetical protein [Spirulina major CS-329]